MQGRNPDLIGRANGGNSPSTNQDNGDLNYGEGPVSAPLRATEELKLDKNDFGFFARATEFFDFVNSDSHVTEFVPLSHEAVNQAGFGGRLLDAYGYGHFDVFDHRVDARIGRMALNWGECVGSSLYTKPWRLSHACVIFALCAEWRSSRKTRLLRFSLCGRRYSSSSSQNAVACSCA